MSSKKLSNNINLEESEVFLENLDPQTEEYTFLLISDKKNKKLPPLTIYGSLKQHYANLVSKNLEAYGVFVTINDIDQDGRKYKPSRKAHDVTRVRAVFADDDTVRETYRDDWPIPPSMIAESSSRKYHYYWFCDGLELDEFSLIQEYIAVNFQTDKAVKDLPRVMRVAGFYHNKTDPFLTRIVVDNKIRYTRDRIINVFPPVKEPKKKQKSLRQSERKRCVIGRGQSCDVVADLTHKQVGQYINTLPVGEEMRVSGNDCGVRDSDNETSCLVSWSEDGFIVITDFGDEGGQITHVMNEEGKYDFVSQKITSLDKKASMIHIDRILRQVKVMPPIYKNQLLDKINSKTSIGKTTLNAQLKDYERNESEAKKLPYIADSVIEQIGFDNLIYMENDAFYQWNAPLSGIWNGIADRLLMKDIDGECRVVLEGKFNAGIVKSILDLIRTSCYRPNIRLNEKSDDVINVINGQLRYINESWKIEPHDKARYATQRLPVIYDCEAQALFFKQFLAEIFHGDEDKEQKSQLALEIIGYAILPSCRFEKFAFFTGNGANGKSVLLEVIEALLGRENVCSVGGHELGNNFNIAHINGKLANIVTEMPTNKALEDAPIKSLVSGELTTAAHKGKPAFEFRPIAMLIFAANHLPYVLDHSDALFRRVLLMRFNRTFLEHEQDKDLKNKLKKQLPGILNLALDALAGVFKRGHFTLCPSVQKEVEDWKKNSNQVARFVDEVCKVDPNTKETIEELFREYNSWAQDENVGTKLIKHNFSRRLTDLGFKSIKSNGVRYKEGINSTI